MAEENNLKKMKGREVVAQAVGVLNLSFGRCESQSSHIVTANVAAWMAAIEGQTPIGPRKCLIRFRMNLIKPKQRLEHFKKDLLPIRRIDHILATKKREIL